MASFGWPYTANNSLFLKFTQMVFDTIFRNGGYKLSKLFTT